MREKEDRQDFWDELNAIVIERLEQGVVAWQKPWNSDLAGTPHTPFNPVSGTRFKGSNYLRLELDPRTYLTGDPRFCTFKHCIQKNWHVKLSSQCQRRTPVKTIWNRLDP